MNLSKKYRRKRHSVSLLHAHLVFCVKYRRRVITRRAFEILRRSMRATARIIGVELVAIQSDGDHLHLMIHYPPNLSLSEIVRRLKGASSRAIRAIGLPEVIKKLWGAAFWSPSYFVVSCGGAPLETIKSYVKRQEDPTRVRRKSPALTAARTSKAPYPRTEVRGLRANL
tara:strand:+ start:563 stop:1072 length:510 start_codon:yes stop_codon:yes gene_type:complete